MRALPLAGFALGSLLACGPGRLGQDDTSSEGTGTGTGMGSSSGESEGGSTGSSDTDTGTDESSTETGQEAVCGDGVVDLGETCDDGNLLDGDTCPGDCFIPISECGNKIYACGDALDNDEDGLVDLYDPECLSPCDDDEFSFDDGLPGLDNECKLDCAWDSNRGGGDDECEFDLKCDSENPGEAVGCSYDPLWEHPICSEAPSEACLTTCSPLTPNACDCFGCCEIDGAFVYFGHETSCDFEALDACASCTPHPECMNPCDPQACELCFLQDPGELPDSCAEPSCPEGIEPCTDPYACPDGRACLGGCCLAFEI